MQYFSKENEPFWKRNSKVVFVTLLSVLVIVGSGTALYFRVFNRDNGQDNSYSNVFQDNRTSLPFTLNANTTVTNRLGLKARSASSIGNNSIQALAAQRFEEVSGKSFIDFAKVKGIKVDPTIASEVTKIANQPKIINSSVTNSKASSNEASNQSTNQVSSKNSDKVTDLPLITSEKTVSDNSLSNANTNKNSSLVVYSENEISNFQPTKSSYITGLSNIDYSKPITTRSWYSANYRKFIAEQNGKIISYTLQTPENYTEFLGGQYAIQQTLNSSNDFVGLNNPDNQATTNWELEFIKSILSNTQIKNIGTEQIDGKTVNVYQEDMDINLPANIDSSLESPSKSSPSAINSSNANTKEGKSFIKYYIDPNEIVLYRTDIYTEGKLTNSSKVIKSLEYSGEEEGKFFGSNEIANVTLKEASDVSDPIKLGYLRIYSPKLSKPEQVVVSENPHNQIALLRFNKQFNPSLDDKVIESFQQSPIVVISQSKDGDTFTTKIFDRDIDLEHYKQNNQQIADKTSFKINLVGNSNLPTNCDYGLIKENNKLISQICSFKHDGYHYLVTEENISNSNTQIFDNTNKTLNVELISTPVANSSTVTASKAPGLFSSSIQSPVQSVINNSPSDSSNKN